MRIKNTIANIMAAAKRSRAVLNQFETIPEARNFAEVVHKLKWPEDKFTERRSLALHDRANWDGATPELREFAYRFHMALRRRSFPMYFHTVYRSPLLQRQLADAGYSQVRAGAHQYGAAFDLVHCDLHWDMPREAWEYVGVIGKHVAKTNHIKVRWGGDFKTLWDPAHWEIEGWRTKFAKVVPHKPLSISPAALRDPSKWRQADTVYGGEDA